MTAEVIRPMAFSVGNPTSSMPTTPAMTKAVNVIILSTSLVVSSTNAMGATADVPLNVRRLASCRTNSGSILEDAAPERSLADAVMEVRRRGGLTWEQLASLFAVDRRSVHLWASGRPLNATNAERLNRVLAILRRADRGSASATKAWLLAPTSNGVLPLDLLREGRFDEVMIPAAVPPPVRPSPLSDAAKKARAPLPPEELVATRDDRVHVEKGKLIKATPLRVSKSK
jgi:hypothetical protein